MRIAVAGSTGVVGSYVVEAAEDRGHDVVRLCRAAGVDLTTGEGLAERLAGVESVVDATSPTTQNDGGGAQFFEEVVTRLQREAARAAVAHLVVLSIVGIETAVEGHPAAKLVHEAAARRGPVPVTVARATQFHEFPAQMWRWSRQSPTLVLPDVRVRTVAARTVGQVLVEVAERPPAGHVPDLAGPEEVDLLELGRRFVEHFGLAVAVEAGPTDAARSWLPGPDARIEGPTFSDWLATHDAARLA